MSCVVFAGPTMCIAKVLAFVSQRVNASLLIDIQSTRVVDREGRLCGHERVGLIEQSIARFIYRPERREVDEELWH